MKKIAYVLLCLLVTFLVSCTSKQPNPEVSDELYTIENNKIIITNFDYNEGTAYQWYYEVDDPSVLMVLEENYVPLKQNQAIGGGPGKYQLKLQAVDSLRSNYIITLVFTYNTFNQSGKHPKTYTLELRVAKTGEIEVLNFTSKNLNGPDEAEHVWKHYEYQKAWCDLDGHSAYDECLICGEKRGYEFYPALGGEHQFEITKTSDRPAYKEYTCRKCGLVKKDYENGLDMENLNILLIGNSYTNYNTMMNALKGIIEAEGMNVYIEKVSYGGAYLYNYVSGGDYYTQLRTAVSKTHFDFVVLQDQSTNPATAPANFYTNVRKLFNYFEELGSICLLYETWTRKGGYSARGWSEFEMTERLCASYQAIADELGLKVSHCGTAVYDMMTNHPTIITHNSDNSHPSSYTSYVVALCHFATIYDTSPIGIHYTYNDYINDPNITWHCENERVEISDELQRLLEQIAYDAVFGDSIITDEYKTSSVGVGE